MVADLLTIGQVAERSGVATSALRFYEERGLVIAERSGGNQRRFHRSVLRRVAVIRAAQAVGLTLDEIREALAGLPEEAAPSPADWTRMSASWEARLSARIAALEALRDDLSGCIGCGCLSLQNCALFNPDDRAGRLGPGPRYLLGDVFVPE
jgi:MerR family redox-sensitive transcriptional activator SoxR